jgi:hypothetical protein
MRCRSACFDGSEWSITQAEVLAIDRTTNTAPVVDAGAAMKIDGGKVSCMVDPFTARGTAIRVRAS